jgi:hypothetical protein
VSKQELERIRAKLQNFSPYDWEDDVEMLLAELTAREQTLADVAELATSLARSLTNYNESFALVRQIRAILKKGEGGVTDEHEQALERATAAFSAAYDDRVARPEDADVAARYLATHTAMIAARIDLVRARVEAKRVTSGAQFMDLLRAARVVAAFGLVGTELDEALLALRQTLAAIDKEGTDAHA